MDFNCKLIKKTFTSQDGSNRDYYVLSFTLADGSVLEQTVKSDKAKLLLMSYNLDKNKEKKSSFLH